MSFQDRFNEAVKEYVSRVWDSGIKEIEFVDEELPSQFYCDTCGPDPIQVQITYRDADDKRRTVRYYGGMAEFIRELT